MQKTFPLDVKGRKLIMKPPVLKKTALGKRRFWKVILDETQYRRDNTAKNEFLISADNAPLSIASAIRNRLYNFVSSSWLDENWSPGKLELEIIAFIRQTTG